MTHHKVEESIVRNTYLKKISRIEREGKFNTFSTIDELRRAIEKESIKTRKKRFIS